LCRRELRKRRRMEKLGSFMKALTQTFCKETLSL
jgi:hypothetical protein